LTGLRRPFGRMACVDEVEHRCVTGETTRLGERSGRVRIFGDQASGFVRSAHRGDYFKPMLLGDVLLNASQMGGDVVDCAISRILGSNGT
jgi:hypothetical protein